jgi:hypothetical protein
MSDQRDDGILDETQVEVENFSALTLALTLLVPHYSIIL